MANMVIFVIPMIVVILGPLIIYRRKQKLISFMLSKDHKTHLLLSPTSLIITDVILVISSMLVKTLGQSLKLLPALKANKNAQDSPSIPEMVLSMPLRLKQRDISSYLEAVRPGDKNPGHLELGPREMSMLLCAITQPTMLLLLGRPSCPIQPLGAVNVRNRFEFIRPDLVPNLASLRNWSEKGVLFVVARPLPQTRLVKRGYECDFEVDLRLQEFKQHSMESVVKGTLVFRQVFTMLQFANTGIKSSGATFSSESAPVQEGTSLSLPIEGNAPSKWAAACKDYNPIHISSMIAKALGFPGKIAHGNLVVARALEAMLWNEVSSLQQAEQQRTPVWVEVEFKRPVVVPAKLSLTMEELAASQSIAFTVQNRGKVAIECRMGVS